MSKLDPARFTPTISPRPLPSVGNVWCEREKTYLLGTKQSPAALLTRRFSNMSNATALYLPLQRLPRRKCKTQIKALLHFWPVRSRSFPCVVHRYKRAGAPKSQRAACRRLNNCTSGRNKGPNAARRCRHNKRVPLILTRRSRFLHLSTYVFLHKSALIDSGTHVLCLT